MERIHSDLIGIGKLIDQSRFSIPPHQRPYAWGEEEVNDLFKDLNDARNRGKSEEYFLGTIVMAEGDDSRETIIDGQQRLVTISILIAAIRNYFYLEGQRDRAEDISHEYLSKRDIRTQEETAHLHLASEDRDFFLKRVVLAPNPDEPEAAPASPAQHRIDVAIKAASAFISKLAATTHDPDNLLLDLLEFVQKQALVISVKVGDEANAFIIFEVLNDRGLDLSVADLLKNYIFRVSGTRLIEAQAAWTQMSTAITDVAEEKDIKGFIRQAWISENGVTREKELYGQIRKTIGNESVHAVSYVKKLADQAIIYAALKNTSHDRWKDYEDQVTESLDVLENVGVTQIRPLLLSVFKKFEINEINKTLPMTVSWTVRFLVCGSGGSGTLEKYYADRAKEVSDGTIKTASQLFNAMRSVLPIDATFKEAFSRATVTNAWLAKFYLRVLEQQDTKGTGEEWIVNPDKGRVNLEHVMPQSAKDECWGHIAPDERKSLLKRIGNLALLPRKLNTKIANADFATKKLALATSSLELTRQIAGYDKWTASEIDARQSLLAELAVQAWPNEPQKIE